MAKCKGVQAELDYALRIAARALNSGGVIGVFAVTVEPGMADIRKIYLGNSQMSFREGECELWREIASGRVLVALQCVLDCGFGNFRLENYFSSCFENDEAMLNRLEHLLPDGTEK